MNIWATLKVAMRALKRNKVRSLLTTLGIIVGIAAVIAMMSVGQGATVAIQDQIKSLGDNLLIIFPGSSGMHGFHGGSGTSRTLTAEDADAILKESPYVEAVTPLERTGKQVVYQENNWATQIQGVNPSYPDIRSWNLLAGRFFTDSEVKISARVAVLGMTVVKQLFNEEDPIGETIRIGNMSFRIIGVLASKGSAAFGMDQDDTIIIPWTTCRHVLLNSQFNDVDQVMVKLTSMKVLDQATADITSLLRQRHHLAQGADDDFSIMSLTEVTSTITQVSKVMTILLTIIASISLMVGGIGIMNIMLVSVTERTREIGLRMAVGARRKDILLQFLVEAMVLSGIGGIIGIGLGAGAAQILSGIMAWPVLVSPAYILIALVFSGVIGIFFGFYPAWRAAKLDPIEALHYE
jgi:putative ABC transport system permease protein